MLKYIDDILNRITMYRLVLYCLIALVGFATLFSFFGLLPFQPLSLLLSTTLLVIICWATNTIFAYVFKAPTNIESAYITALILALIITPVNSFAGLSFLGWTAILSMASKYILTINKKHIFNPAAFAITITAITINQAASWWIGTLGMMPFVLVLGLLIVRKTQREDLIASFLLTALIMIGLSELTKGIDLPSLILRTFVDTPILFFAFIMLTEPLTTPPTKLLRIFYGLLVGIMFSPQLHIGSFYFAPETALIIGNIYSYMVSPKDKLILKLKEMVKIAPNIYNFSFVTPKRINFVPGQYMEWTLSHPHPDNRGNRRYFTLASSPTEENLQLGIRLDQPSSSFKKALISLTDEQFIIASQLRGDFTLPNKNGKYVFIAGGIGITPFRSMIKYLLDTNQPMDIILFYSNREAEDIVYGDILNQAEQKLGIKIIYTLTDTTQITHSWQGAIGRINEQLIQKEVPDYKSRIFYLSGPHSLVNGFELVLKYMGIPGNQVKTDFFPGFV